MNQDKAINFITGLIPDIKSSKDPVPALLKAATAKKLSPAQLEKVGMVYNNMLALHHLNKAASDSRGASFPLLDIESLVSSYKTERGDFVSPPSSAAMPKAASTPSVSQVVPASTRFPLASAFSPNVQGLAKAAKALPEETPVVAPPTMEKLLELERRAKQAAEESAQFIFEAVPELEAQATQLSRKLAGSVFSEACEDMRLLGIPEAELALQLLEGHLQRKEASYKTWDGKQTKRLVSDRHNVEKPLRKLAGMMLAVNTAQEQLDHFRELEVKLHDALWNKRAGANPKPQQNPSKSYPPKDKTGPNKGNATDSSWLDKLVQQQTYQAPQQFADKQQQAIAQTPILRVEQEAALSELPRELAQVQSAWQTKVLERKRLSNLSRVMIQDPIVSTADPVDVMEIYNNLIPLDPNIADKPMLMTQTMRTAIQQQTLDPHELRVILEIEKNNLQTNDLLAKDKDRGAYGGAKPPSSRPANKK